MKRSGRAWFWLDLVLWKLKEICLFLFFTLFYLLFISVSVRFSVPLRLFLFLLVSFQHALPSQLHIIQTLFIPTNCIWLLNLDLITGPLAFTSKYLWLQFCLHCDWILIYKSSGWSGTLMSILTCALPALLTRPGVPSKLSGTALGCEVIFGIGSKRKSSSSFL